MKLHSLATAMVAGFALSFAAVAAEGNTGPLDSTAWQWAALVAKPTDVGARREVVQQPTRTLDELEMHITTLNPHTASHAPHTHPNEEMVIVKEGTLQAHVNGKEIVVPAGGVLFFASMQPHAVQNIGDTPATYYVINWASPGTRTKKIPPTPAGPPTR
jgi:XRE family transcriptional regulator, regulator of sulfur utilization